MAVKLENKTNVEAPSADFPFGNIKDNTGAGNGTPVSKATMADYIQFFAKMLHESGIVANGLPDNEANGFQYFNALLNVIAAKVAERLISTGQGLQGGGDLSANRTLSIAKTTYRANQLNATSDDLDTLTDTAVVQLITGQNANAPSATAADIFLLISTQNILIDGVNAKVFQVAIKVNGAANLGAIYTRDKTTSGVGASYSAWTLINNP